jgi:hypothetical protein
LTPRPGPIPRYYHGFIIYAFRGRLSHADPLIAQIGIDQRDSDDVALQKMILIGVVLTSAVAAALWGFVYIAVGARTAGAIPAAYSVLSLANTALFSMFRRYQVYRFHPADADPATAVADDDKSGRLLQFERRNPLVDALSFGRPCRP